MGSFLHEVSAFFLQTFDEPVCIFAVSLHRSNAVVGASASDLEAHLHFDSICTPSSNAALDSRGFSHQRDF